VCRHLDVCFFISSTFFFQKKTEGQKCCYEMFGRQANVELFENENKNFKCSSRSSVYFLALNKRKRERKVVWINGDFFFFSLLYYLKEVRLNITNENNSFLSLNVFMRFLLMNTKHVCIYNCFFCCQM